MHTQTNLSNLRFEVLSGQMCIVKCSVVKSAMWTAQQALVQEEFCKSSVVSVSQTRISSIGRIPWTCAVNCSAGAYAWKRYFRSKTKSFANLSCKPSQLWCVTFARLPKPPHRAMISLHDLKTGLLSRNLCGRGCLICRKIKVCVQSDICIQDLCAMQKKCSPDVMFDLTCACQIPRSIWYLLSRIQVQFDNCFQESMFDLILAFNNSSAIWWLISRTHLRFDNCIVESCAIRWLYSRVYVLFDFVMSLCNFTNMFSAHFWADTWMDDAWMEDTESKCPASGRLAKSFSAYSRANAWKEDLLRKYSHCPSKSFQESRIKGSKQDLWISRSRKVI